MSAEKFCESIGLTHVGDRPAAEFAQELFDAKEIDSLLELVMRKTYTNIDLTSATGQGLLANFKAIYVMGVMYGINEAIEAGNSEDITPQQFAYT